MPDADLAEWFGPSAPIGDWPAEKVVNYLREIGEEAMADEFVALQAGHPADTFGVPQVLGSVFSRFIATTNVCGFLPAQGTDRLVPITKVVPDPALVGTSLRVTFDSLHVAQYPGKGTHTLLFNFRLQNQQPQNKQPIYHYNAKFRARNGETVPVHDFPVFHGFSPVEKGLVFGFEVINLESSFDKGLLDFLDSDEFKVGLSLLQLSPVVGQVSQMCAGMARWLAGQSKNAPVQSFWHGLGFAPARLAGGLAEGYYVVAQIPVASERDWDWNDWMVDPVLQRLVQRDDTAAVLDFNHFIFGLHRD